MIKKTINNDDIKKNIEQEKFVNIPKKKFQSTPSLTLVKLGIRKDIFGEEIKKGGNHRINFVDDKMTSDDNIEIKLGSIKLILLKLLKL